MAIRTITHLPSIEKDSRWRGLITGSAFERGEQGHLVIRQEEGVGALSMILNRAEPIFNPNMQNPD